MHLLFMLHKAIYDYYHYVIVHLLMMFYKVIKNLMVTISSCFDYFMWLFHTVYATIIIGNLSKTAEDGGGNVGKTIKLIRQEKKRT